MSTESGTNVMGGLVIAFLAGAAVGAAVTALMTPKTGPQLRDDLRGLRDRFRKRNAEEIEINSMQGT